MISLTRRLCMGRLLAAITLAAGVGSLGAYARAPIGDTVFVPEELDKSTFVQSARDWMQILYEFGIGLAGIRILIP